MVKKFAKRRFKKTARRKASTLKASYGTVAISSPRYFPLIPNQARMRFVLSTQENVTSSSGGTSYTFFNQLMLPWFIANTTTLTPTTTGLPGSFVYTEFAAGLIPYFFLYQRFQVHKAYIKAEFISATEANNSAMAFCSGIVALSDANRTVGYEGGSNQINVREGRLAGLPNTKSWVMGGSQGGMNHHTDYHTVDMAKFLDTPLANFSFNRNPAADILSTDSYLRYQMSYPCDYFCQQMPAYIWIAENSFAPVVGTSLNFIVRYTISYDIEMSSLSPLPTTTEYCPGGVSAVTNSPYTSFQFSQRAS